MAFFTIRVELNNHDNGDYDLLHEEMEQEDMIRVVRSNGGNILDLPTGTYSNISAQTTEQVFGAATSAVKRVIDENPFNNEGDEKDYQLIVTCDPNPRRFKLKANTDKSKLPKNKVLIA